MGLFKRLNDMINASLNDLIDRVEDPEATLKQLIREMEENVSEAKDRVIDALSHEKHLRQQLDQEHNEAEKWHLKAKTALDNDNELGAREALTRKQQHTRLMALLEPNWTVSHDSCTELKQQLQQLELKLREAQLKRQQLIARQNVVLAKQQLHDASNNASTENLDQRLAKMEDQVFAVEARAAAMEALEHEFAPLQQRLLEITDNDDLEADLVALKNELKTRQKAPIK